MKSIASCFKMIFARPLLCKELIAEDFRRYWLIPVIASASYFFSAVFPILMSYQKLENFMGNHIRSLLQSQSPLMFFFNVMLPLIAATTLYRYMHTVSSTAVVHAMPFNRNTLFNSHFAAGFSMSILPVLLNGLILLLISKPLYLNPQTGAYSSIAPPGDAIWAVENVFARSNILNWMWQSVLIIAVIYAIAAFTTSVTGNSIMHFTLSGVFIGLTPGILALLIAYFTFFLHGYTTTEAYTNFIMGINPVLQSFRQVENHFSAGWIIWYLASILVMYLLGSYFYLTKKLERASESITFRPLAVYMSYVASFFGMTALGFYLYAMSNNNPVYMYLGFAAGAVIVYLMAELIISKSWNIFNKKTFVRLGAYFAIAAAFLLCLNFDVTGYERRVPDSSKVSSVYLYEPSFSSVLFDGYNVRSDKENRIELKTEENIQAALRMHAGMTQRRSFLSPQEGQYAQTNLYFDYRMKNGRFLTREYNRLPMQEFVVDNADLKTIMESEEFKSHILFNSFYLQGSDEPDYTQRTPLAFKEIDINGNGKLGVRLSDQSELSAFHDCVKQDLMSRSFEEMLMPAAPFLDVNYQMVRSEQNQLTNTVSYDGRSYSSDNSSYYINIDGSFRKTIGWLKANGYYDDLILDIADIHYITIDKILFDENGYPIQTGNPEEDWHLKMQEAARAGISIDVKDSISAATETISSTPPTPTATKMVITDKEQIAKIMSTYNGGNGLIRPLSTYTVRIFAAIPNTAPESNEQVNLFTGNYYDMTIPAEFAAYFR